MDGLVNDTHNVWLWYNRHEGRSIMTVTKEWKKLYMREYRAKNKEHLNKKVREWRREDNYRHVNKSRNNIRKKMRLFIGWLKMQDCIRCGFTPKNPAPMDFHHIDSSTKEFNISKSISLGIGQKTLQEEIMKCELICSNCHREGHWNGKEYD